MTLVTAMWAFIRTALIVAAFTCGPAAQGVAAGAEKITWVTAEGSATVIDQDLAAAKQKALQEARRAALQKTVCSEISTESLLVNLRLSGSLIGAVPFAKFVETRVIDERQEETSGEAGKTHPIFRIKIKAAISQADSPPDPGFRLVALLNQASFKDGDEMFIRITPTQDCYCSIFVILEDDRIIQLLPNRFTGQNLVKASQTLVFPSESDMKRGIKLKVSLPTGQDATAESVYAVALKQPVNLGSENIAEGIFGVYDGNTGFLQELISKIAGIPPSDRTEALLRYEIRKH
jgi:hypothetical protein